MEMIARKNDYLSKHNTNSLKGLLSVFIVIHHLWLSTNILRIPLVSIILAGPLGYWSVSLFFFLSGYGIWNSVLKKGREYIKPFPRNRILPFFCVNTFLIVLYTAIYVFLSDYETLSFRLIAQSFLWGDTVIKNGWYLQVQMLLYVAFFVLSFFTVKKPEKPKVFFVSFLAFEIIYIALCMLLKMDAYWYLTVMAFLLGVLWRQYKEKTDELIKRHKIKLLIFSFAVFAGGFLMNLIFARKSQDMIAAFANIISILFFDITVILLMYLSSECKIYNSRFMQMLGRYSFGTYVLHGAWMCILRGTKVNIANDYLYVLAVVVLTAVSTVLFTPLYEKVFAMFKTRR